MQLLMFLGDQLIDSLQLNLQAITPNLVKERHRLEDRNSTILEKADEDPIFALEGIPSKSSNLLGQYLPR